MINEWHEIKDIEKFRARYANKEYVILVDNGGLDFYDDIAFGLDDMPDNTAFFHLMPISHKVSMNLEVDGILFNLKHQKKRINR